MTTLNFIRSIFRGFANGCVQMFIRISEQVDKTSGLPLAKFVAKAISFGFDRAIYDRNCN